MASYARRRRTSSENWLSNPLTWVFFAVFLARVAGTRSRIQALPLRTRVRRLGGRDRRGIALAAAALYPRLVPARPDLADSLTIYNASSTPRTLTVMLVIALVGMPFVIGYTVWIYRVFRGRTVLTSESY